MHSTRGARALEKGEGAALHRVMDFDEVIDFTEAIRACIRYVSSFHFADGNV